MSNQILLRNPSHLTSLRGDSDSNNKNEISNYSTIKKEYQNLLDILLANKIKVNYSFPSSLEILPFETFPASWLYVHPDNTLVMMSLSDEFRRKERLDFFIEWIYFKLKPNKFLDLRNYENKELFLEGTESIVFDHKNAVAYACESPQTNIQLFEALCQKLNYQAVSFLAQNLNGTPVRHTHEIINITSNTILFCSESINDEFEKAMILSSLNQSSRTIIDIPILTSKKICTNIVEISNEENEDLILISNSARNLLSSDQYEILTKETDAIILENTFIEELSGKGLNSMIVKLN